MTVVIRILLSVDVIVHEIVHVEIVHDTLRLYTRTFVYNPAEFHRWRWISDSHTKAYRSTLRDDERPIAAAIEAACVDLPPVRVSWET